MEKISSMEIVPSGRIDWCCECREEHGYDCPLDDPIYKKGWEARKWYDIKLLKTMPSYWIDRMIRTLTRK
jgi:hypothetical protein